MRNNSQMNPKNCSCPAKKSDAVDNLSKIWYPPNHTFDK